MTYVGDSFAGFRRWMRHSHGRAERIWRIGCPSAVHLPTPEDLIILKAVAHRPQDLWTSRRLLKATSTRIRDGSSVGSATSPGFWTCRRCGTTSLRGCSNLAGRDWG
jgi:hypothetical protein